jgi:hypothetical protein
MPAVYMQPDTLLVVLRNLLKQAYEREQKGEVIEAKAVQAAVVAKNTKEERPALKSSGVRVNQPIPDRGSRPVEQKPKLSAQQESQLSKLEGLRGILTEEEYQAARKRIMGG